MNKRQVGTDYEQLAADYLRNQGFTILSRNYRTRLGEIDIIAKEGEYLCFIEVKYRSSSGWGSGAEAVDFRKQQTICRVAKAYLTSCHLSEWTPCRFDVISVSGTPETGIEMELLRNAFSYI